MISVIFLFIDSPLSFKDTNTGADTVTDAVTDTDTDTDKDTPMGMDMDMDINMEIYVHVHEHGHGQGLRHGHGYGPGRTWAQTWTGHEKGRRHTSTCTTGMDMATDMDMGIQ